MNQVVVVIPSLNPDEQLKDYVAQLLKDAIVQACLVVDDGSEAYYRQRFDEIDALQGCHVLHHRENKGKGAALKTAFAYYLEQKMDERTVGIVTADSDGQHRLEDVARVAGTLAEYSVADQLRKQSESDGAPARGVLILGTRHFSLKEIPLRSRFGNQLTVKLFYWLYHVHIEDTQTGLRGISNELIPWLSTLKGDRYEFEMNMLSACAVRHIPIQCVPITTVYESGNTSSHFKPVLDSIRIYRILLGTFLKFALSSLMSSIVDLAAFQVLVLTFRNRLPVNYIVASTICARVISGIFNFSLNRRVVFQSDEQMTRTAVRYFVLWFVQMMISAYGVQGLHRLVPLPELFIKIVVDTALFFIGYRIQKNLIFKRDIRQERT